MWEACVRLWGSTGSAFVTVSIVTAAAQVVLFILGAIKLKKAERFRWGIDALSLWVLTFGILVFLDSIWRKHLAIGLEREGVSALSASSFNYLYDIIDSIPCLYISIAVFLLGRSYSIFLCLASGVKTRFEALRNTLPTYDKPK